ncbi:MAG TPA: hypothetical protein VJ022_13535 [Anaerolineales bacterium]|nr:hypothetical protein [Anaerolineales bacterium]
MAERKLAITATGQVSNQPCYLHGWVVTTALSAAAITLQDGLTAAGDVVGVIPASTAAGAVQMFTSPIKCTAGLYATVAGTGTVLFIFE